MIALACSSHLLVDLPLFGGPVAFVIGAVLMIRRSERRAAPEAAQAAAAEVERPSSRSMPAGSVFARQPPTALTAETT